MSSQSSVRSAKNDPLTRSISVRMALLEERGPARAEITLSCSSQSVHIEPYENMSELKFDLPTLDLILVHDKEAKVAEVALSCFRAGNPIPIVAYSENPAFETVVKAMKAGASDYLRQPFDASAIHGIICETAGNLGQIQTTRVRQQIAISAIERLSPRERQVLVALSTGLTSQQIAEHLAISIRTVEVHRFKLRRKLGSIPTAAAVRLVVEGGFDRASNERTGLIDAEELPQSFS